jgi:hypothetical protein
VLGYAAAESYNGGPDDNFLIAAGSPAIDRGDTWAALPYDITGGPRVDDPSTVNAGSNGYLEGVVLDSVFGPARVGTAQGWHADDAAWALTLNFVFPFYGTGYGAVRVSSNGLLQFAGAGDPASGANSTAALTANARIAPLWDDLHTNGAGDDIFVDDSVADQVAIRWDATNKADGADVDFTVVLFADGRIRFDYGGRPAGLTPTVGVSQGDGTTYALSAYNGQGDLNSVDSLAWDGSAQYADAVLDFSSQYYWGSWSAAQTLGPPDTFDYGDRGSAWAPASQNGTSEYITVSFATPVYASGATIRETYGNGFVTQVDVLDTGDALHTVWTGTDPSLPGAPADFRVTWPQTAYLVKGLKVYTDTDHDPGAGEEIDAIQLHGNTDPTSYYAETALDENRYFAYDQVGVAKGWRWDNTYWWLDFGFEFSFYGRSYTGAFVSDNGFLQFGSADAAHDPANSTAALSTRVRLAPLWDDLRTDGPDDDIFVETSTAGQVTIRWDATNKADDSDVNFAVTLFDTGEFRFDYGPGNDQLTPTVGISRGDGYNTWLSAYNGRPDLTSVPPVRWAAEEVGFVDLGAYEFRGDSSDTQPPYVAGTVPAGVHNRGELSWTTSTLALQLSEGLNTIDALAPANYELRRSVNGTFDDGDDVLIAVTPFYEYQPLGGTSTVTLTLATGGQRLPLDTYRLTVRGSVDRALHDIAGNRLDGDQNGTPGPDYVREFAVVSPTLVVTTFTPAAAGFVANFSRALEPSVLNLYDSAAQSLGATDVTVVGANIGTVRGSLILSAANRQIAFVRTGGPLAPDTYTVTLRSAANGFRDPGGQLLDGNADGTPGDTYTTVFTVVTPLADEVVVSIPDFARGYGQAVNLPRNTDAGLPITLSTGQNVSRVCFDLIYNPALLTISGFISSVPGATPTYEPLAPGLARFTVDSAAEFSTAPGSITVGRIAATVPDAAPYASKQVLDVTNLQVLDATAGTRLTRPARDDDGVHVAAYFGDTTGNGLYSGSDVTLLQRVVVGSASGFAAFQLADPGLIADINGSGAINGSDVTFLQRVVVGTPVSFVPPLPSGLPAAPAGGPDPRVWIPTDLRGVAGQTVTVPVNLTVTEPAGITLSSVDLVIGYDAARFAVGNVRLGTLLGGTLTPSPSPSGRGEAFGDPLVNLSVPGIIRLAVTSGGGTELLPLGASGSLVLVDLTVKPDAAAGTSALNLRVDYRDALTQAVTSLADRALQDLVLSPAPTNADTDAVDGRLTVVDSLWTDDALDEYALAGAARYGELPDFLADGA